ncbi:hypothetical protein EVAR_58014_1 [Eumeta japonica]|uniref:Uncharacterized protein n=1 Tax=Eumeta variegata TaxID=151549 RepID=A0A4C1Y8K8_EUMVA|nr:hypothetical protein EVAR_58014_1 [Eumeta japonica]
MLRYKEIRSYKVTSTHIRKYDETDGRLTKLLPKRPSREARPLTALSALGGRRKLLPKKAVSFGKTPNKYSLI